MIIYFVISGMIGNLVGVVLNKNEVVRVGSDSGIFGIMGCGLGYLIFNWTNLDYNGSKRGAWAC